MMRICVCHVANLFAFHDHSGVTLPFPNLPIRTGQPDSIFDNKLVFPRLTSKIFNSYEYSILLHIPEK